MIHTFPSRDALAVALAAELARAVAPGGTLVLSGGRTPDRLLHELSRRALPWDRITVVPVDERWVPETSDRSNGRMIRAALPDAHFVSLWTEDADPESACATVEARLKDIAWPPAAVVLGMGTDGHVASWFPDADRLGEALYGSARIVAIRAPSAGEPRITWSRSAVLAAQRIFLHVEGPQKRAVLQRPHGLPVATILERAEIYTTPETT